jgi:hypothetical protein
MLALEGMTHNGTVDMSPTHIEQMLAETSRAEDIVIDGEEIWLMRQASNMPGEP